MHFTKTQNNVQALVNLHIRPIVLFRRQYFLQEVFVRFYFTVIVTATKVSINFTGDKEFRILLLLSVQMLFIEEKISLPELMYRPKTILSD